MDERNRMVGQPIESIDENTSDGFHTFRELYDHRRALTAALLAMADREGVTYVWRSRNHHPDDSPCFAGYFIVGIELPMGTVTYHYADQFWDDFRQVPTLAHAPKWDGALAPLSITRLTAFARG